MLEEKKAPDFIDIKRMGGAFDPKTVAETEKYLSDIGVPSIPYNATMDELRAIQGNANNSYGRIKDCLTELKIQFERKSFARQQEYAKVYTFQAKHACGTKDVLKMTVDADEKIVEMDKELLELKAKISMMEARLDILRTTLQTVKQDTYALGTLINSGLY